MRKMDRLWAPWRIKYISAIREKGCIFCGSIRSFKKKRGKNYVVFRSKHSFCILNTFPYNNGHVMISPIRHVKELAQLKDQELLDLLKSVNTAIGLLKKTLKPQGFNIGINISRSAGAGIKHIHIHIVPRWQGDTNFMPIFNNTKIVSQSLDQLYKLLKSAYKKIDSCLLSRQAR